MSVVEQLTADTGRLMEIPIKDVKPSGDNPRRDLGELDSLAASIASQGVVEPLIVVPNGKGYVVVAGHRRLAAAKVAKLKTVPAIVRDYDDTQTRAVRLVENLQRQDLDAIEEAEGFRQLRDLGSSQRDIAAMVGCNQSHVSKRLKLLELPEQIRDGLAEDKVAIEDALELAKLAAKDEAAAVKIYTDQLNPHYYGSVANSVIHKLRLIELAEKRAQIVAEFEKSSVPLIDLEDVSEWQVHLKLPAGAKRLEGRDGIGLDPKKHNGESCHAIALDRDGGQHPVCTDPARHREAREDPRERAQRIAEKEQARQEREAEEARRAALVDAGRARQRVLETVLRSWKHDTKAALEGTLEIALDLILDLGVDLHPYEACQLLGLDVGDDEYDYERQEAALRTYASQGPRELIATLLALNAGERERGLSSTYQLWGEKSRTYLDWLVAHGHELTDAEKAELKKAAAAEESMRA